MHKHIVFYVYWSWPKPKCATREGPSKSTITFFFGYYWEERWYKFAMHSICAAELQLHCVSAMRWPELCFAWSLCSRYRWSIRTRSAYVWTYLSIGGVWWCSLKHLRWAEVSDFIYWRIIYYLSRGRVLFWYGKMIIDSSMTFLIYDLLKTRRFVILLYTLK